MALPGGMLVVTDHVADGNGGFILTRASKELLTLARDLVTGPVWAVALNNEPPVEDLGLYGVTEVLSIEFTDISPRVSAAVADAVLACIEVMRQEVELTAVMCVSNFRGKEVAARLAIELGSGAVVDATSVNIQGGDLVASRDVLAGAWVTSFGISRGIPVIALRPSAVKAVPLSGEDNLPGQTRRAGVANMRRVEVDYSASARAVQVVSSHRRQATGQVNLPEAAVVVCGGRGVDGDFALVENLAEVLGGAVGSTRVAADEGWADRSTQIGQTGVSVAPQLYIGLGVSGAVHHTSGVQGSGQVVAVCDDPDAPIFTVCDFGVVGDVHQVVPQTLTELTSARVEHRGVAGIAP